MTACARFEQDVVRALAGELSPERSEALRAHLRGCASCRAVWDRAAELETRVLGEARFDRMWSTLERRLEGEAEPARARPWAWVARPWVGVAAAAALGALVVLWWRPSAPDAWSVRGEVAVSSSASLRLVRVVERGAAPLQIVDIASDPRVEPRALLIPLVTNLESAPRWVSLWVQEGDRAPVRQGVARQLGAGTEDQRLEGVRVEAAWSGQAVTFWAVFAPGPEGPPIEGLVSGDRDGVSIRRLVVHVTTGPTGAP